VTSWRDFLVKSLKKNGESDEDLPVHNNKFVEVGMRMGFAMTNLDLPVRRHFKSEIKAPNSIKTVERFISN